MGRLAKAELEALGGAFAPGYEAARAQRRYQEGLGDALAPRPRGASAFRGGDLGQRLRRSRRGRLTPPFTRSVNAFTCHVNVMAPELLDAVFRSPDDAAHALADDPRAPTPKTTAP